MADYTPTDEEVRTVNHDPDPFAPTQDDWVDANGTIVKMPCSCGELLDCDADESGEPWPDMLRHRLEALAAHDAALLVERDRLAGIVAELQLLADSGYAPTLSRLRAILAEGEKA